MNQLIESILKCKVVGNIVYLPPIREGALPNYPQVKKAIENAGGKYKKNTFVFPSDAQPFIDRITGGESVNIKQEFQFFATPDQLADRLAELADVKEGERILEPSAGQGAIVKAINRATGGELVYCYELMPQNQNVLKNITTVRLLGDDFLNHEGQEKFDKVVANPPFTKNQDIDHIKKMYDVLRKGGRLVTIASPSWTFGSQKKQVEFREWLNEIGAHIEELPAGTFKESGTSIKAMLIVIDKAA
jgi:predicted RNA methylase